MVKLLLFTNLDSRSVQLKNTRGNVQRRSGKAKVYKRKFVFRIWISPNEIS